MQLIRARLARLARSVGLVRSLVLVAVLVTVGAVGAVQSWSFVNLQAHENASAMRALQMNQEVLRLLVTQQGNGWRLDGDKLYIGDTLLNGRNDLVDRVKQVAGGVATIFAGDTRIATNVVRPDGSRGVGTKLAPGPAYEAAIRRGEIYRGENEILGRRHLTIYEPVRDASGRQVGLLFVGIPLSDTEARLADFKRDGLLGATIVSITAGLLVWLALAGLLKPLRRLAAAVRDIGNGRLETEVPCTDRRDLLGEIGRAVATLRENSRRAREMEAEAAAARQAAEQARARSEAEIAQGIEAAIGGVVRDLAAAAAELQQAVQTVGGASSKAEASAGDSERAVAAASDNVQAVAAAAEELSASIAEISRQVTQGARVAQDAVQAARASDATVSGLNEAADRIGDVVRLIADIAGQTNLLALNATIEAARAGEAGKGFAVVASEVKQLAAQTAKATEEIGAQIAAMRTATEHAVGAMRDIAGTVSRIDEVTGAIAAAVEQQGAATREIARHATEAAGGTSAAAQGIRRLRTEVTEGATAAAGLTGITSRVAGQGSRLQQEVAGFVARLRAAS